MTTQLAIKAENLGRRAEGFCTPQEDKQPQKMKIPPRRVIPIVFVPGIMGSNLRMTAEIQQKIGKSNNVAWRPDRLNEAKWQLKARPATRQLQLDPRNTVVDTYDGGKAPTGDRKEDAQDRHDVGSIHVLLNPGPDTPLLSDDPITANPRMLMQDKAKNRGWSEVYFSSYRNVLELCEQSLNSPALLGGVWGRIVDTDPAKWQAASEVPLTPLTLKELKTALGGSFFPVHAMGYNWLNSNEDSALELGERIDRLIHDYKSKGYQCEKVIVLTHSMGGLVGRALIHPTMGNRADKVLGMVHGVQPALGAPAAYRRMRCGFDEGAIGADPVPKVLGNYGSEVTAVLGNSPGGLQLLPNCAYGNGWLRFQHMGEVIASLPTHGDPYEEIYKLRDRWFGLLREEWLNPAGEKQSGIDHTCALLDMAKSFHASLADNYHDLSYCHYGIDPKRKSWESVTWMFSPMSPHVDWPALQIKQDNQRGLLALGVKDNPSAIGMINVVLGPCEGAGDQTVPLKSSDAQLKSGRFKGVFRQEGYEHQSSYSDLNALHSTLYCIAKIALKMTWCEHD